MQGTLARGLLFLGLLVPLGAFVFPVQRRAAMSMSSSSGGGGGNWFSRLFKIPDPEPPYVAPFVLPDKSWRAKLTADEYYVLREAGTERPWTSELNDVKAKGTFVCAGCGSELFTSAAKFNSGTGWPSFFEPSSKGAVVERTDSTLGMRRTEILCANCGGHLGHSFRDGPRPTGIRYCINGVSLKFQKEGEEKPKSQMDNLRNMFK